MVAVMSHSDPGPVAACVTRSSWRRTATFSGSALVCHTRAVLSFDTEIRTRPFQAEAEVVHFGRVTRQ